VSDLCVWMNGEPVATWSVSGASHRLVYQESWLDSPRTRPLSLSLPITANRSLQGDVVRDFFENLLPEDTRVRERARSRFRARSGEAFDLLHAIGRDCVGAIQLLPPGADATGFDRVEYETLSDEQVEQRLLAATSHVAAAGDPDDDTWRISLAGAQEKTALLKVRGRWAVPRGATPTTHILKLPLGFIGNQRADMRLSVQNEWFCLNLLREVGLAAAECEIVSFGSQTALSVERFDRLWSRREDGARWIARLPQEDLCQSLGLPSSSKYEHTDAKGRTSGPTMERVLKVLGAGSQPRNDVSSFLLAQLMSWVLGNTDGHAKNFSLFLHAGRGHAMTPLYDVVSMWPVVGDAPGMMKQKVMRLAIPLRAEKTLRKLDDITPRDWVDAARRTGVDGLRELMARTIAEVGPALDRISARLPQGFPARLWDKLAPITLERARRLAQDL
jgi:serine/threonine-protein kinase HipA